MYTVDYKSQCCSIFVEGQHANNGMVALPLSEEKNPLITQLPPSTALPPLMQLQNLEKWTPRATPEATPVGTPKTTPRKNPSPPCVLQRSISEPCGSSGGATSSSAARYSPDTSVVPEEADGSTQCPLSLSDAARKCAIQVCAIPFKEY